MAVRREIRLRKDFLYRKQVDAEQTIRNEKKRKIRSAIDDGKALPTELIFEARQLQHESELDVNQTDEPAEIDDEYANVGNREPKVCITTSRDPSSRLKQFAKEVKITIPNSQSINRGNLRIDELVDACRKADFTDVIMVKQCAAAIFVFVSTASYCWYSQ